MKMLVSGVSDKNGEKIAYVSFDDGDRMAEAVIPECKIIKHHGFDDEELSQLVEYMKDNLAMLKRQAAGVNPIKAMMKD